MKKITLIDYYGNCDTLGKAVGHSPKVLKEYCSLIDSEYQIEAILPECIADEVISLFPKEVKILPYQIVEEGRNDIGKRILDKVKLFANISQAIKKTEGDLIWFYCTDFFLFFYFYLHKKPKKVKIFCLVFQQMFGKGGLGKVLDYIYRIGLSKFDGVVYTQKYFHPKHPKSFYMPDYYYDCSKYEKYVYNEKKFKVVCLGTMNPYKKLEELVDIFNENKIPLEIIGKFFSMKRFDVLKEKAGENIYIENIILSEDLYYRKLSEAQFVILPYDIKQYAGRTSGVLIEALFMQTVPVAPYGLLEENAIEGIGYYVLNELSDANLFIDGYEEKYKALGRQLINYPKKEEVQKGIVQFISDL